MAEKRINMSKIKQVLQLHLEGMSNRSIASHLGLYKGTVNDYVNSAKRDSKSLEELLKLDEPTLEHRFSSGNPAYSDGRFTNLQEELDYYVSELRRKHITMRLLWEEYKMIHPDGYSYTQFCFHINQHKSSAQSKVSIPLSPFREGGKEVFFDFAGDTMSYIDLSTGEEIKCQIFVACLPASDYGFAMAVHSQKVEDMLYAAACCFREFGGVPRIIVTDNLKSSVIKSDRYMPDINTIMDDFANHYGCAVIPTRAGKPKDKALVEDQVKLVYRRVYAPLRNEQFFSLDELNKAIFAKMKAHNQTRMQRILYTREERFLSIDKPALKPLPVCDFEIKYRTVLSVMPSSHVYLGRDGVYYSVPCSLVGKKVKVIYTRSVVMIYSPDGQCVATHERSFKRGTYCTINSHMPSYYNDYANPTAEKYISKAFAVSDTFGTVIKSMFEYSTLIPELHYKSCDGLFHLQKCTDEKLFYRACQAALTYKRFNY